MQARFSEIIVECRINCIKLLEHNSPGIGKHTAAQGERKRLEQPRGRKPSEFLRALSSIVIESHGDIAVLCGTTKHPIFGGVLVGIRHVAHLRVPQAVSGR